MMVTKTEAWAAFNSAQSAVIDALDLLDGFQLDEAMTAEQVETIRAQVQKMREAAHSCIRPDLEEPT